MINKEEIFRNARRHLDAVIVVVKNEREKVQNHIVRLSQRVSNIGASEDKVEVLILANNRERNKQLKQMSGSPYFMRCDAEFNGEDKELYFGKFHLVESNVYSWVAPIAQLRFADIGSASYKLPKGETRAVSIKRKDQFMIVDGKVMFMASESADYERVLIHQESLASKKNDFVLPEIVAQMEKAQDEVIRAPYIGSFLISGPAGSGKTTLAFHRIAYLTQSPDTAKIFPGFNIIVFVQDESTKKYFSAILPQLGIEEVTVTTFEEWALDVLGLSEYGYVQRFGEVETEKDEFEYYKNLAIKDSIIFTSADLVKLLKKTYSNLPTKYLELLNSQLEQKKLDRFDLTVLLKSNIVDNRLEVMRRVVVEDKQGNMKMVEKVVGLAYSFIVVDEAENYLAEQIQIIKACINENKSILYVGDLAQQTKLGTIKNWDEAGENFSPQNKVVLDKVYRNTKEILEFVRLEGFDVNIPIGLKNGEKVVNKKIDYLTLENEVKAIINHNPETTIGILYDAENEKQIRDLNLNVNKNTKLLTYNEAQGVEFEVVILCRFTELKKNHEKYPEVLKHEKQKIKRDLWYVAMTRSMNQLFVYDVS